MMNDPKIHRVIIHDAVGVMAEAKAFAELASLTACPFRFIAAQRATRCAQLLDIFSYLLPKQTRERIFQPFYQEILEDHLAPSVRCCKPWQRRLLAICFAARTAVMVADCFRVMLLNAASRFLFQIIRLLS